MSNVGSIDSGGVQSLAEIEQMYDDALENVGSNVSKVSNGSDEMAKQLEVLKLNDEQLQAIIDKSMRSAIRTAVREAMKEESKIVDAESVTSEDHLAHLIEHKKQEFREESKRMLKAGVGSIVTGGVISGVAAIIDNVGNQNNESISPGLYGVGATSIIAGAMAVSRATYRFVTGHKLSEQVISGLEKVSESMAERTKHKMMTKV